VIQLAVIAAPSDSLKFGTNIRLSQNAKANGAPTANSAIWSSTYGYQA